MKEQKVQMSNKRKEAPKKWRKAHRISEKTIGEIVEMSKLSEQKNWLIVMVTPAHDSGGSPQIAALAPSQGNFGGDQTLEADSWNTWEDLRWGEGNMVSRWYLVSLKHGMESELQSRWLGLES